MQLATAVYPLLCKQLASFEFYEALNSCNFKIQIKMQNPGQFLEGWLNWKQIIYFVWPTYYIVNILHFEFIILCSDTVNFMDIDYVANLILQTTEKRYRERKMTKSLNVPFRISLTKMDELHISDPHSVDGWNIIHLSTTKV